MQGGADGPRRSGPAVVLLGAAQVLVVFDTTVFTMGLPRIMYRSGLDFTGLVWLLTVYSVCFAALPVLATALGRAFGQRRVLMAGLALSSAAAVVPAVTADATLLLASRAVQGIAAAVITAGALALIDATHAEGPGRDRALNVHFAVVAGAGPAVLLPTLMLLDLTRPPETVFWVQAAAGLLLLLLTPFTLGESEPVPDAAGRVGRAALAVVPLGFLAWFTDWLGNHSTSATTVIAVAVAGALVPSALGWFGRREQMPELLARLGRERAAFGAYTVVVLLASGLAGFMFALTLALQEIGGLSPMQVGWTMLSTVAGLVLGCLVLPRLAGAAGIGPTVAGACGVAAAGFLLLTLEDSFGAGDVLLPLLLVGFGCGVLALPAAFARSGSGALPQGLNASRQLGAGLGVSLFDGIFTAAQQKMPSGGTVAFKDYKRYFLGAVRDGFVLGVALALTAAVIALLTLSRRSLPEPAGDPGVSGGAPTGTAGSPGSSAPSGT
ncbi:MFS transporter [Streptomyces sp. NPDC127190]|uniref:MFS transporter n=1 Tax=unclassified Streptomyces TaxID=2593676 RepID=UPI0036353A6E